MSVQWSKDSEALLHGEADVNKVEISPVQQLAGETLFQREKNKSRRGVELRIYISVDRSMLANGSCKNRYVTKCNWREYVGDVNVSFTFCHCMRKFDVIAYANVTNVNISKRKH